MPEALKIIQFSKENMNGLYDSRLSTRNELVRGLLDIVLRNRLANREFDCNALRFKQILSELSEEYDRLKNQLAKNKIKNVDPELERLVININSMIIYLIQELDKDRPSEINLSTYLVRLAKYTNELESKYNSVLYPEKKKLFQILRESKPIKKLLIGLGLMSAVGAGTAIASWNKNESKVIEIKDDMKKPLPAKTKVLTAEEIRVKAEEERINKEKEIARKRELERIIALKAEYEQVKKKRGETITKVRQILSRMKMPTNYIQPRHIMALIWSETRFNPNATNGPNVRGIMQVNDPKVSMDLEKNIKRGLEILKEKEKYCRQKHPDWDQLRDDRKIQILFAAYNCGQSRLNYDYDWKVHESNDETVSHDLAIWDYINHLNQSTN